ncbi:molybdopterin-binding protein [Halocynthiibacter namhaensis]|uniref:molybdopterin-binding protein n=1 Tax=Halocynthiibacter namhaensis TaxID=1290553 RepID=UPI00057964D0|nr:molybdopterin-binding protein [Halocynthiibacter namhaensis]
MKFGNIPVAEAEGAILGHGLKVSGGLLKKGSVLRNQDIVALSDAGVTELPVAQPDDGDVGEDQAAARVAQAISGAGLKNLAPIHGRVNLVATADGVLRVDTSGVTALNLVDEAVTLATLQPFSRVSAGTLVATAKMIPYFVAGKTISEIEQATPPLLSLSPFRALRWGLVLTQVEGMKDSLLTKAEAATRRRVERLGGTLVSVETVDHREGPLARALSGLSGDKTTDVILILTGSATSDRADVAPSGVARCGGRVTRFGLPVDPGNLLFLGELDGRPVIGLPGCARSLALNGADWILERIAADISIDDVDLAAMGVGGLLKDVPERGEPRRRTNPSSSK